MKYIDLNADLGEAATRAAQESELHILDYISSANIACGGHAGDEASMRLMVRSAKARNVIIGAHPAYPDRDNFGRVSQVLNVDIKRTDLVKALIDQINRLQTIAEDEGVEVSYVKPHGALYNDAVNDRELSDLIVSTVKHINSQLWFMGAPNSEMKWAAERFGLRFVAEGFIDRKYTDAGHLVSRSENGAVLNTVDERSEQLSEIINRGCVTTASGREIALEVATLCLHGDSDEADETAKMAHNIISQAGFKIRSFTHE